MKYSEKNSCKLFIANQFLVGFSETEIKTATDSIARRLYRLTSDNCEDILDLIEMIAESNLEEEELREDLFESISETYKEKNKEIKPSLIKKYVNDIFYLETILSKKKNHPLIKDANISEQRAQTYMEAVSALFKKHIEELRGNITKKENQPEESERKESLELSAIKKETASLEKSGPALFTVNLHGSFHKPTDAHPEEGQEHQGKNTPDQKAAVV